MSLLNYLQMQKIDEPSDDAIDKYSSDDDINLNEQVDETALESFWDSVVQDIHEDPEWFSFDND